MAPSPAAILAMLLPCLAGPADEPRSMAGGADVPIFVLLDGPDGLAGLRKRLEHPDFVLLKGATYEALKAQASPPAPSPLRGVVESVVVGGEVREDAADLAMELTIGLTGPEPAWVPIRLDGVIPSSVREGAEELPIRSVEGSWQVQVRGEGTHRVVVATGAKLQNSPGTLEGRGFGLAIPEAASTRVRLVVGPGISDVATTGPSGTRESLVLEPIEGGQRHRLVASLTPRRRLDLSWRGPVDNGLTSGPPLLTAQGEIAVDVQRGTLRTQSTYEVRSERGTVSRLEVRIDPSDELIGLESDGRPVLGEGGGEAANGVLSVPLAEPLRRGGVSRLVITTRRNFPPEATARVVCRGNPFLNVVAQTGVVAVAQRGGDPWVGASAGRGLRQIDPKTDLPPTLRALPSIVLAYQFVEQPFELALQVDPAPPWVQVRARSTVTLESGRAWVDTWLDYSVRRGRIFDVRVAMPPAMTLDAIGPESAVAASERIGRAPDSSGGILACRLTPRASEDGRFSIHLTGWQPNHSETPLRVGLPRSIEAQSRGGLVAVLAPRELSVEVGAEPEATRGESFDLAGFDPPINWTWPAEHRVTDSAPPIWVRFVDSPPALPLRLTPRSRVVTETTTLAATVRRERVELRQVTELRVRYGILPWVDVEVPGAVEGTWEVDSEEVVRREPLGEAADGHLRYRLYLTRPGIDSLRLRFRLNRDLPASLVETAWSPVALPYVRFLGVESEPIRASLGDGPGVEVAGEGAGWSPVTDAPATPESGVPPRLSYAGAGPIATRIRSRPLAALPPLVASRLLLRTTRDPNGGLWTSARYRLDRHDGSLVVGLPAGAEWIRASVDGRPMGQVERVAGAGNAFRLTLAAGAAGPAWVMLDYRHGADRSARWDPPRLLGGGVVQECRWEVRVPWTHSLVGVPSGWSDANRWVWSTYAFIRSPRIGYLDLLAWAGPAGTPPSAEAPSDREAAHSFLFWRVGEPGPMQPYIVSRAWLVGLNSGIVLAAGLALVLARPRWGRAWAVVPLAMLAAAVFVPPTVLGLAVQSSLVGVALVAIASLTKRFVERRAPSARSFLEPGRSSLAAPTGPGRPASSSTSSPKSAAEESTVIRARPGTTVDHAPATAGAMDPSAP